MATASVSSSDAKRARIDDQVSSSSGQQVGESIVQPARTLACKIPESFFEEEIVPSLRHTGINLAIQKQNNEFEIGHAQTQVLKLRDQIESLKKRIRQWEDIKKVAYENVCKINARMQKRQATIASLPLSQNARLSLPAVYDPPIRRPNLLEENQLLGELYNTNYKGIFYWEGKKVFFRGYCKESNKFDVFQDNPRILLQLPREKLFYIPLLGEKCLIRSIEDPKGRFFDAVITDISIDRFSFRWVALDRPPQQYLAVDFGSILPFSSQAPRAAVLLTDGGGYYLMTP